MDKLRATSSTFTRSCGDAGTPEPTAVRKVCSGSTLRYSGISTLKVIHADSCTDSLRLGCEGNDGNAFIALESRRLWRWFCKIDSPWSLEATLASSRST